MKKLLAIMLAVVLMFTFAACGDDKKDSNEPLSDATQNQLNEFNDAVNNIVSESTTENAIETTPTDSGWQAKLNEFEAFVDNYIVAMNNGEDLTAYDAQGEAYTTELEAIGDSLSADEQLEFASEYLRITTKLTDAMGIDMNEMLGEVDSGLDDYSDALEDYSEELEDALAGLDF